VYTQAIFSEDIVNQIQDVVVSV